MVILDGDELSPPAVKTNNDFVQSSTVTAYTTYRLLY